jgi:hypothetical protein
MFGIHSPLVIRGARRADRATRGRPDHKHPRRRLTVEPLEERALLSTWLVNSLGDAGAGSGRAGDLRYVITQINQLGGDNLVNFSVTGTIALGSPLPSLNNAAGSTDIEGPGARLLTVSGSNAFRVFEIDQGATVTIARLRIANGYSNHGGGFDYTASFGGGVYSEGNLTLRDSTIDGNVVEGVMHSESAYGGGVYLAGPKSRLLGDTFSNNAAVATTIASWTPLLETGANAAGGGLYVAGGDVIVSDCVFHGNEAQGGPGAEGAGFFDPTNGPAIWGTDAGSAAGGAIAVAGGKVQVQNSAITSNHAIGGNGGDALFPPDTGTYEMHLLLYGGSAALTLNLIPGTPFNPNDLSGRTYWAEGGNGGSGQGGGIAITGGSVSLTSNTFSGNQAQAGAGGSAPGGYIGFFDYGGYDYGTGQFFDIRTPLYAGGVSGTPGSSSGDAIGGSMALLQNNSFDTLTPSTVGSITPLVASQITVNQGQAQRSNIESLSVQFNQDTNVQALIQSGAITSAVQVVSSGGPLALTPDRYQYDGSTHTLTIDVTKGGGSHTTMLPDGRYQLTLDTGAITALGSAVNHLNLLNSAVAADARVHYDFFRLLGDLNGDGVVSSSDLVIERNQLIGYAGAVPTSYGDINGDGVVDINDYIALRLLLGRHL